MFVRLTKEFGFEMAHTLSLYQGPCRNIHGHSYRLMVTVGGQAAQPSGMVMDFKALKDIVVRRVVEPLDHAFLFWGSSEQAEVLRGLPGRLVEVDFEPTCENLVCRFAADIMRDLPAGVRLLCVRLYETATSYAEWLAQDNPDCFENRTDTQTPTKC